MTDFTETFEKQTAGFISSRKLLHDNAPVIVALSGGADSVALLAVLSSLGYDCRAAHCNFHLRGDESTRDMEHARTVCDILGVNLYVKHFDVAARQAQTGESVEMACRELRYKWFDDLLDRDCAQAVAVGHHREDRAETFMLNLMRGTGIAGLTAMKPRSANIVRPLLSFSRSEIEQYLALRKLPFIHDSSNASDAHRRNRLRNRIFPLLEELFPGASEAILRTVANLESTETIYREAVNETIAGHVCNGVIDLNAFAAMPQGETFLFELLHPAGFNMAQVRSIISTPAASGLKFISANGSTTVEVSRGKARIVADSGFAGADCFDIDPLHDIDTPIRIAVSRNHITAFDPAGTTADTAFFDARAVDQEACWQLRRYRRGDRIVPFGSKKSKLLSDLFTQAKYDAGQKRDAWVMTRDGEPVWVPGLRNSAMWAIGPDTVQFITMKLI